MIDEARAVEEHVEGPEAVAQARDRHRVADVEQGDLQPLAFQHFKRLGVDVCGDGARAFSGYGARAGPPDALTCAGDETGLALQSVHLSSPLLRRAGFRALMIP